MIEIVEVKTIEQRKTFAKFVNDLYEGQKWYVPAFFNDEVNVFTPKGNASYYDSDMVAYLCYKDGILVGRIMGIEQKVYNAKVNENRVRFTRFDAINDIDVAKALFGAVEDWAKSKGMNIVHGPLGFNDLEREGMLIEGFDCLNTFEEQYNYAYYKNLLEQCGYDKEVDWVEYAIYPPKEIDARLNRISDAVMKRFNLRLAPKIATSKYINKYHKGIFNVIDKAYGPLHGTVPFNEQMQKQILTQFKLLVKPQYCPVILNEKDEVVAFGLALPNISKSVNKCKGKLFPFGFIGVLLEAKNPKYFDLGLIGVLPEYLNKGVNSIILREMQKMLIEYKVDWAETNLNLEDNEKVQSQWEMFEHKQTKRRRCFIKHT